MTLQMKADAVLELAGAEVGTAEEPYGSNRVKYNTAYYGREVSGAAYPWCCVFLWWVFWKAGLSVLFYGGGKTASCGALADYAKRHGLFVTEGYRPGDLIFFRFSGSIIQHVGLLESIRKDRTLITIEGNTGSGDDANGGQVQRRSRAPKYAAGGYRPAYGDGALAVKTQAVQQTLYEYLTDVPEAFRPVVDKLMTAGILQGDGSDPSGNGDRIDLTHEQVRTLVFAYRGGAFDKKFQAVGLEPAVG
jgi:hypothetical protein